MEVTIYLLIGMFLQVPTFSWFFMVNLGKYTIYMPWDGWYLFFFGGGGGPEHPHRGWKSRREIGRISKLSSAWACGGVDVFRRWSVRSQINDFWAGPPPHPPLAWQTPPRHLLPPVKEASLGIMESSGPKQWDNLDQISGQIALIPKPELGAIWVDSRT